ncbi:tRNA lysidine(34) synthetase TilS [Montanilutibacter psychrotolerans]|uniref:tRNA(Ile)-lysidine synthase n=1 Tax=Montanilutibacter psychrotolerans TaxID=1327343 RepID=A0A3M8T019_9GAMM|nr:tRNA lysidine(34) synthetase TilS [Lysobacter psychrotolerans]RNF86363.1 tRNA lysidine(34) synthetase TilS [Lysobacter psychrotolerans]
MPESPASSLTLPPVPATPLCVGHSGGLDSMVLLHALATSAQTGHRQLRALHVHHGLHPDADAWAAHCQRACDELGVPLRIVRVEVPLDGGEGVEAAARHARHAAFAAELGDGEVLALAHHRDDQAETFLLRALRASGVDGLGAMRAWRDFARGHLWRPLLEVPRAVLQDYAARHDLRWIDDPSNADHAFDRNFLRHRVLPLLRERWPTADAALARSAELAAQAGELLDHGDAEALAQASTLDPHCLQLPPLLALPEARRARVLRRWIATLQLPPLPGNGVERIERELLACAPDSQARFRWGSRWGGLGAPEPGKPAGDETPGPRTAEVRRWRDLLHAGWYQSPLPPGWRQGWDGSAALVLPDGASLRLSGAARFDSMFEVRTRHGGERITLPGRGHSHALKHVLQTLGVPPWQRERLPLLFDGEELLAAGDLAYSARFDAWLREHAAGLSWTRS